MNFSKANSFSRSIMLERSMGPNPLKLCEELLETAPLTIPDDSVVLDLGSGTGLTSALLAREYGFTVYAADLWSNPSDNLRFFESVGLSNKEIIPLRVDAVTLPVPFANDFFDAVVSVDSYNYFGRDSHYLKEHLLPLIKQNGIILITVPGMVRDCHDNLPSCLLKSWTPEQLDYMHDIRWWNNLISQVEGINMVAMKEMDCTEEAWNDWLACDNEYARSDRAAIEADALEYLNTIMIALRKL